MAKKFLNRLGTKVGGALGTVQRTELDEKIRTGIQRLELTKDRSEKILKDLKDSTPGVSGMTNHEKFSQVMRSTAGLYGSRYQASSSFNVLAEALNQIGRSERELFKKLSESCYPSYATFLKTTYPAFSKEKERLQNKLLDLDGAKNKNQRTPSQDTALREQAAFNAYMQQRRVVEGMIDQVPTIDVSHAASIKAYTEAMIEFHHHCEEQFQSAAEKMI